MEASQLTDSSVKESLDNGRGKTIAEKMIYQELLASIAENDVEQLEWFSQFGTSVYRIVYNVVYYRNCIRYGFEQIHIDKYGWLQRPVFFDEEIFILGNPERYSEQSSITIGRGLNGLWTYGLSYNFGCAGGGYCICVTHQAYADADTAKAAAIAELRQRISAKKGNTDTMNYNQQVIRQTLRDIEALEVSRLQLSLF